LGSSTSYAIRFPSGDHEALPGERPLVRSLRKPVPSVFITKRALGLSLARLSNKMNEPVRDASVLEIERAARTTITTAMAAPLTAIHFQ
jgi:hypothetical protein